MNASLEKIAIFAGMLRLSPLAETGAGDSWYAVNRAEDRESMTRALAYAKGYADAARLACSYMGPSWQIANLLGVAAGTFLCMIDANDPPSKIDQVIATYVSELTELCERKRATCEPRIGDPSFRY